MTTNKKPSKKLSIAFVHPDLGIGGAERLVIDAAVGLQGRGHQVVIYTSHHDPAHCFEETRDGTLEVRVRGGLLIPRTIFGHFHILCAILRQFFLTYQLLFDGEKYDVLFVDQLSTNIPLLRLKAKVFFYCHFPDKLLTRRDSLLKRVYRAPIDLLEEVTTACSDTIVVNSKFTKWIFSQHFRHIRRKPDVLYPCINLSSYDTVIDMMDSSIEILKTNKKALVSINRFERKKNVALAIKAFAKLRELVGEKKFHQARLFIAGGYDSRVTENVEHLKELQDLAKSLKLSTFSVMPGKSSGEESPGDDVSVLFLCSFSAAQRTFLLQQAQVLLYTPTNEHFGIVPLEAMYAGVPVISTDSGGPRETVMEGETGFRRSEEDVAGWAECMAKIVFDDPGLKQELGNRGRAQVVANFALDAFVERCEIMLQALGDSQTTIGIFIPFFAACILVIGVTIGFVLKSRF